MKSLLFVATFLVLTFVPCLSVFAQSPEMPVPGLVVKDADGKVMGQVAGFLTSGAGTTVWPVVALNVDGKLAYKEAGAGQAFLLTDCPSRSAKAPTTIR